MRHHDRANARLRERAEGEQLDAVEPVAVVRDDGQVEMRIHVRVAVTGKMFGAGEHIAVLQAHHILEGLGRHVRAVFAVRALIDDRVGGVVVHVHIGREVDLHPEAAALSGDVAPHVINQFVVLHRTEHHGAGVGDGAGAEAHPETVFVIARNHEWHARAGGLVAVGEFGLLLHRADERGVEKTQTAGPVAPNQILHLPLVGRVLVGVGAQHEELAEAFLLAQGVEYGVHPQSFARVQVSGKIKRAVRPVRRQSQQGAENQGGQDDSMHGKRSLFDRKGGGKLGKGERSISQL